MDAIKELAGRVAVVTGASSGIGEHTALALATRDASVALLARRADRLAALAARIRQAGGRAAAFATDVTDAAALAATAAQVRDSFGPAGVVFNNAGMMLPTPVAGTDAAPWDRQVDLNIRGLNHTVRAFVPQLIEAAATQGVADLVNTASIAARTLFPTFSVYAASKAYVTHFGNTLRAELGPRHVRVTTLEPGIVDTELQSHIADDRVRERLQGKRQSVEWLQPEDVAELVCFVARQPVRVNLTQIAVLPTRQAA